MKKIYLLPVIALTSVNAQAALPGYCESQVKTTVAAFGKAVSDELSFPQNPKDTVLTVTKEETDKVIISNEEVIDRTENETNGHITTTTKADFQLGNLAKGTATVRFGRGGCYILKMKFGE